eukprot:scaffold1674_cov340-Prasinococcus_capsulatus_cf.AAC.7
MALHPHLQLGGPLADEGDASGRAVDEAAGSDGTAQHEGAAARHTRYTCRRASLIHRHTSQAAAGLGLGGHARLTRSR